MIGEKLLEAAGNSASAANYIEDVFSTYLYTGVSQPGSSSAYGYLINNIDLLTKGGMIWTKDRSNNATGTNDNVIVDTLRGTGTWPNGISNSPYYLKTNTTAAQATGSDMIQGVTTTGYYIGPGNTGADAINTLNNNYASWTFRKQPKFFDIQTFSTTTEPTSPRTISHNLGSTPGFVIVKNTSNGQDWYCYHRSTGDNAYMVLNTTQASGSLTGAWSVTDTTITIKENFLAANSTFVVYIYAHNAGGFGLTGTDNVISCGSVTGSAPKTVTLGYEPQWVMIKRTDSTGAWYMADTMRGLTVTYSGASSGDALLTANSSSAESAPPNGVFGINSTGFVINLTGDYIYIAIRRGPMKVPTDATKVFSPITSSGTTGTKLTTNFPVDSQLWNYRGGTSFNSSFYDRLRGVSTNSTESGQALITSGTAAETSSNPYTLAWDNTGFKVPSGIATLPMVYWNFQRAPSFFDEVCYRGDGAFTTVRDHNLGVQPELIIVKSRSTSGNNWAVAYRTSGTTYLYGLQLNTTIVSAAATFDYGSSMSATTFNSFVGSNINQSETNGATYVAYLFATCAGVSKVGSYTGNGSTQTINCGFAGGARFVLIKRTDSTGDWYVYDTARGMTTLVDPYLLLNSTSAESATLGSVTTVSTGFAVNASILAAINTNGASYVFFAVA